MLEQILHRFHVFRNLAKAKATALGPEHFVTHARWFVLMMIEHFQARSIKDIAGMMEVSSSAATQLVDALVYDGFVVRREDPKDRRFVQLEVTSKGKRHITATKEKRIREMQGLFEAFSDKELEELLRLLNKIS